MFRWPMLVVLLCLAAFGLVACGGDGDDASVDTILSDTFGKGKEVKSGRLDLSLRLDAQGLAQLAGPLSVRLSGPFESQGSGKLPKFDFQAAIDAGGQQLKAGAVSTSEKGFLSFQDQPYVLSDEMYQQFKDGYAQQAKCNEQKDDTGGFAALGINPRTWLSATKKAGTGKVGGADTTHITGSVDVPKFLEDVNRILARTDPQQGGKQDDPCATGTQDGSGDEKSAGSRTLTAEQRKDIAAAIKDAKVDIWTGADDRTMRRMKVTLKFEVPEGQRPKLNGLSSGTLGFDLTIADLNEEQTIKAPENAKPFDQLVAALNGGLAGGTGGSGSGGAGGGSASGGGSKYDRCIQSAGQDVAKLQDCADLVGQ